LLQNPFEIAKFVVALKKEKDRLESLGGDISGGCLGEIALERAIQHLGRRAQLHSVGYRLAVQVEEHDTLRAYLFLESEQYVALYPVSTFSERITADIGIVFPDRDREMIEELFRLEAELFQMSFHREGGTLEDTSGVLLQTASKLARF
jgi:hypothetical protein